MSPSAKKRPKNGAVFEIQDEEPQDRIQQAVSKEINLNRLKRVLKRLSLLRILKHSNHRFKELYKLGIQCWNSLFSIPTVSLTPSGNIAVSDRVDQNNRGPQETLCSEEKLESKKSESKGRPKESKGKVRVGEKNEAQQSRAAMPERKRAEPEVPTTPAGHGLTTGPGAQGRQLPADCPRIIFLKTRQQRPALEDMGQLEAADQWLWFEGLPTRIQIPGPRVMCRSSTLRFVRRCCTRFCSASLELPMSQPYRV